MINGVSDLMKETEPCWSPLSSFRSRNEPRTASKCKILWYCSAYYIPTPPLVKKAETCPPETKTQQP